MELADDARVDPGRRSGVEPRDVRRPLEASFDPERLVQRLDGALGAEVAALADASEAPALVRKPVTGGGGR